MAGSVSVEANPSDPKVDEFGGGYFVLFGVLAGFFVTVAVALTVLVAGPAFSGGDPATSPPPVSSESTSPPPQGDPVAGDQIFSSTCSACHGPSAEGLTGLGPALVNSSFVSSLSDQELVTFLEVGRPADHPDNTTGIAMPPKGGNPSLSDDDLRDVVAYLRTLRP